MGIGWTGLVFEQMILPKKTWGWLYILMAARSRIIIGCYTHRIFRDLKFFFKSFFIWYNYVNISLKRLIQYLDFINLLIDFIMNFVDLSFSFYYFEGAKE